MESQSHHSGIETVIITVAKNKKIESQSHHSGIESKLELRLLSFSEPTGNFLSARCETAPYIEPIFIGAV